MYSTDHSVSVNKFCSLSRQVTSVVSPSAGKFKGVSSKVSNNEEKQRTEKFVAAESPDFTIPIFGISNLQLLISDTGGLHAHHWD